MINCSFDNTQCQKDIKEVKIKLRRVMQCMALNDNKNYEDNSIISSQVFPGVRRGRKDDR